MWVDENRKAPVADFLGWLLFISVFAQIIMLILEPASVSNAETGKLTFAYVLYAIIGILFTTPAPAVGIPFLFGDEIITGRWWQVVLFIPVMFLFGGFEEIGWRGYLQPILEKKYGFIVSTLINCSIWIIWHIPLCFIKGTYQYSGNYLWFVFSLVGSAFSLAALHNVKGNIIPCILFHAGGNAALSYGLSINEGIGTTVSYCIQVLLAILVSYLCNRERKTEQ